MPNRAVLAALALLAAACASGCFHSIYNDADACSADVPCADPARPYCFLGNCVATPPDGGDGDMTMLPPQMCTSSTDCTRANQPICDTGSHLCRGCTAVASGPSSECQAVSGSRPFCDSSGSCVECVDSRNCIDNGSFGTCMNGSCVACKANAECASGICNANGKCADPSTLVYVSISGKSCSSGGPGSGTLDDPYCAIQTGMDQGVAKGKNVVVFSGTYQENVVAQITNGSDYVVTLTGVGQPSLSPNMSGAAFRATNSAHNLNVTLDGFVIQGASGHGVSCVGGAGSTAATKLSIVRSTIKNSSQHGIDASGCALTVDQDVIGPGNLQGGVFLASSDFSLTNDLVLQNGTAGTSGSSTGGVQITGTYTTGHLVNLTSVGNRMKSGIPGLSCSGSPVVFNVVTQGNTTGSLPAQEMDVAGCTPNFSSFVGASTAGGMGNQDLTTCGVQAAQQAQAIFVDPTNNDYHPRPGGTAPCSLVGLGTTMFMTVNATSYDLEGKTRSTPYNIGAY